MCGTLNLAYFQDFAERLAAPFVKRVIPNSFAESGRETDRTMRLECRGRKQDGAARIAQTCSNFPITSEPLQATRKVPPLPSFGVQARDDKLESVSQLLRLVFQVAATRGCCAKNRNISRHAAS